MFNNLIESSSHAGEFKRRGSFVLFTTATYVLLFIVAGVASIYAYDARLDYQNTEFVTMLSPLDLPAAPVTHNASPPRGNNNKPQPVVRANDFMSINHPEKVPDTPSAKPNVGLPVPDHGTYERGNYDSGPVGPAGIGSRGSDGNGSVNGSDPVNIDIGTPPPLPAPVVHAPIARMVSKGVITGLAIVLPKPGYPTIAKQARAHGPVNIQVVIDESGRVISAKALSGNPLLMAAAQQAAYAARFSPTKLGDQAVKVSGVITYNFVLQ
jgi:protein TonB